MYNFQYRVSIIVPVYNVENYLPACLDSLVCQTINPLQIEVLLLNDGSTDNSLQICKEYAMGSPIFKVIDKENEGVSATRNRGIRMAQGKYIMFLDSDDTYTPKTVELVVNFFDKHYNEVDVVSYYDQYYYNGEKLAPHARYQFLTKTGIYDLRNTINAMQVRLNIAIKNQLENTPLFDESMSYQEDQKFCSKLLQDKLKLGFVKEAQYNYLKNDTGIVATSTNVISIFDNTISYFEEIFASYPDQVPAYYQILFIHDIAWKLNQHCLIPYHYTGEAFDRAYARLIALIQRLDVDVLMKSTTMDNFHKYYFLKLMERRDIMVYPTADAVRVMCGTKVLRKETACEIIVYKIQSKNNRLCILAMFKSMYGSFIPKPNIYVQETCNYMESDRPLEVFLSSDSYYKAREITNTFWGFYYECDMNEVSQFKFLVELSGIRYPTKFFFMASTAFHAASKRNTMILEDYSLRFQNNSFYISSLSPSEKEVLIVSHTKAIKDQTIVSIRNQALASLDRKIWLYYDCKNVKGDNGYYQFEHDAAMDDGIERYYVSNNSPEFMQEYVRPDLWDKVISFGSILHKVLFTCAEKVLTAYIEYYNYNPLVAAERFALSDLLHYELIYLQHGILHATLPWKYTPERCLADKVVVSSYFEQENFVKNYNFRPCDIFSTGMGRFNRIAPRSENHDGKRRILFAPTWRQYLIDQAKDGTWLPVPNRFINSNYFAQFQGLFSNERLAEALKKYNCILEVKSHPIFEVYNELFTNENPHIEFVDQIRNQRDYDLFITDFSSFTFDFAYCKMPIVYFVPDMYEFQAGLNQYRQLDLPFEKAFGQLVTSADEAVEELIAIMERGFSTSPEYQVRMDEFYLPMEDSCDALYRTLMGENPIIL